MTTTERLRLDTQEVDIVSRDDDVYTQRRCGVVYRLSPSNVRVLEDITSNDWAIRIVH